MPFHQEVPPVCHCGIRPGNIFVRDRFPDFVLGDPSTILGPDFASVVGPGVNEDERLLEYVRCTAPEVYRRNGAPTADFYSLGCVAYELMCGEPPFDSGNLFDMHLNHSTSAVEPPSQRRSRRWDSPFGAAGDAIILRFLAKRPEDRYQGHPERAQEHWILTTEPRRRAWTDRPSRLVAPVLRSRGVASPRSFSRAGVTWRRGESCLVGRTNWLGRATCPGVTRGASPENAGPECRWRQACRSGHAVPPIAAIASRPRRKA